MPFEPVHLFCRGVVQQTEPTARSRHNACEDNADAHMKRRVMGRESVIAVTEGRLNFNTWAQFF